MDEIFLLLIENFKEYILSEDFLDDLKYVGRRLCCNCFVSSITKVFTKVKNHSNANKSGSNHNIN